MEISNRLKKIADMVRFDTVADIGTDHGYVPIYLHKTGKIKKGIACDINAGPLKKAKENIAFYCAENVIETRLGNGLTPLCSGEVDSIIIAGMGGMLTIELLKACPDIVKTAKEFILSPHLDWENVRRYLHEISFTIESEQMLKDSGKFYCIIRAVQGKEKCYENHMEYLLGKTLIEKKDTVLKEYVQIECSKKKTVIEKLLSQQSHSAKERLNELNKEVQEWEEVYKWLSSVRKL